MLHRSKAGRPDIESLLYCRVQIGKFYQGSEMLTHQALEMLKRRTGSTKAQ
jgi:shikimate 5-dehydrogenase